MKGESGRRQRHKAFQVPKTGAVSALSTWLLACAELELKDALADRGPGMARTPNNHWSPHCTASLLLLVAGLEAWLNESTVLMEHHCANLREVANSSVRGKYCEIPKRVAGKAITLSDDLDLVLAVRDEIAHFLPMTVEGGVPKWLGELQSRELFITEPDSQVDYDFAVKLVSYALAYWAWETVHEAVTDFLDALGAAGSAVRPTAANFEGHQSVCAPGGLPEYDARYVWRRRLAGWFGALRLRG